MSFQNELYLQKLKSAGYSDTVPRSAVYDTIRKSEHEPMTMAELVRQTTTFGDRASIYRSVKLLEKIGVIKRVSFGWKYRLELGDDFHGHHHHLTCTKCHKTEALSDDAELEKGLHRLAARNRFTMQDHQLDIRGICEDCKLG
jgi:Fur family transcriptional regulator, ferric uptake regulator